MVREALVVPVQAPAAHQSGQGPFDDPAAGKDLEGALPGGLLHDLHHDAQVPQGEGHEFAGVAAVGPDQHDESHL